MTASLGDLPEDAVLPQVCTPCMAKLDARPWHRTLAVRTGALFTGVRVNTPAAAASVEELLAPVRVPEMDTRVSPNFSVELNEGAGAGHRRLQLIYRDHEIVGRRREVDAVLLDLVELLDEVPKLAITERPVVHATGVLSADGAVLVPGRYHTALLTRRDQLAAAGLELLRTRTQQIDVDSSTLLLRPHDRALSTVLSHRRRGRADGTAIPLATWCVPAMGNEPFELPSAQGVFAAVSTILNRQPMGTRRALESLAHLARTIGFVALPELPSSALARTLADLRV